jgi:hypothetical protein
MPSHRARKCSSSCEICTIFIFGALWLINSKRQVTTERLMRYFPGIASLYGRARDFWAGKGATFEFGLFCHFAINVDVGQPVSSVPHRDGKNLAFGVCVIVPFGLHLMPFVIHNDIDSCILGYFPHGVMAWLVNLEAKIVIQLPPMVPYFCMSSVITHFNVDKHGKSSITASRECLILMHQKSSGLAPIGWSWLLQSSGRSQLHSTLRLFQPSGAAEAALYFTIKAPYSIGCSPTIST